jgi:DNA adenine methylase
MGGKFYLKNEILPLFPKNINDYIEPFIGGGSIFLNLQKFGIRVKTTSYLNDLSDKVFTVWKIFWDKESFDKLMKLFDDFALYCESIFKFLQTYEPKNEIEKAFCIMLIFIMSFQGKGKKYYIGINDVNRKNNKIYHPKTYWKKYLEYLRLYNSKISNQDYSVFFTKSYFNRKTSFFYIDSPYHDVADYTYDDENLEFTEEMHIELSNFIKSCKGTVFQTINDDKFIREIYEDDNLTILPLKTRYCMNSKSQKNKEKSVKEIAILNYNPQISEVIKGKKSAKYHKLM